jgi:hypothetical protein
VRLQGEVGHVRPFEEARPAGSFNDIERPVRVGQALETLTSSTPGGAGALFARPPHMG